MNTQANMDDFLQDYQNDNLEKFSMKKIKNMIKEIQDENVQEAMYVTFDSVFPHLIDSCQDENVCANLFISLSDMIKEIEEGRASKIKLEDYMIGRLFPELCDSMIGWLDMDMILPEKVKNKTFETFDNAFFWLIWDMIFNGLENGTILPEELIGEENEGYEYE